MVNFWYLPEMDDTMLSPRILELCMDVWCSHPFKVISVDFVIVFAVGGFEVGKYEWTVDGK